MSSDKSPHILFPRSDGETYRRVSLTAFGGGDELNTGLACQRVYYEKGRGLCLGEGSNPFGGDAVIFDSSFELLFRLEIGGIPSRVLVAPDGRYGAVTVFVSGHSYAEAGFFTRTAIIDMS
jgi:hypothetical protein